MPSGLCSSSPLPPSPPAEKATDLHEDRFQLSVALRPLRLPTIHRAENIASALKRGVNVCQRQFVNEVLGPLVTEFIRNFGGEDATPIQHAFPTVAFWITSRLVKLVRHVHPHRLLGAALPPMSLPLVQNEMLSPVDRFGRRNRRSQIAALPHEDRQDRHRHPEDK